jgi:hypothetical protein
MLQPIPQTIHAKRLIGRNSRRSQPLRWFLHEPEPEGRRKPNSRIKCISAHPLDRDSSLQILHLSDVIGTDIHICPSQHNIAGGLKCTLAYDDTLTFVTKLGSPQRKVGRMRRRRSLFDLKKERIVVILSHKQSEIGSGAYRFCLECYQQHEKE